MTLTEEYNEILIECTFIAKPDSWFVKGTEVEIDGAGNYNEYSIDDKFGNGWSLFDGLTNETYEGYVGELPRMDGDSCDFEEFLIYDEYNNEISNLTLSDLKALYREQQINKILDESSK